MTGNSTDTSQNNYAEWKKPDKKEYMYEISFCLPEWKDIWDTDKSGIQIQPAFCCISEPGPSHGYEMTQGKAPYR